MRTQGKSITKPSGGRLHAARGKRVYEVGSDPQLTQFDENKLRFLRTRGGHIKSKLLSANVVNLLDPKTHKYTQAKIKTVVDNPANRNFIRRNIITKGCIVQTDKGKAKVTSRPSQDATVNAVLV